MRLTELEPQFVRYETRTETWDTTSGPATGPVERMPFVETLAEAQGIFFLCPTCFAANGGAVGTHGVAVSFADRGVADHQGSHDDQGQPSRWNVSGDGFENLTTTPSIHLKGAPCAWHGFITNGEVT